MAFCEFCCDRQKVCPPLFAFAYRSLIHNNGIGIIIIVIWTQNEENVKLFTPSNKIPTNVFRKERNDNTVKVVFILSCF